MLASSRCIPADVDALLQKSLVMAAVYFLCMVFLVYGGKNVHHAELSIYSVDDYSLTIIRVAVVVVVDDDDACEICETEPILRSENSTDVL